MAPEALKNVTDLIRRGFFVFPVLPNSKDPWPGFSWQKVSTRDVSTIERWLENHPDSNWGIDCGKSGLTVIDVDRKKGKRGPESLAELDLLHGVPETLEVATPSGGLHLLHRGATRNRTNMLPGIDIRSVGGFIVAPGSSIDGVHYRIVQDRPIAEAPKWLVGMVGSPREKTEDHDVPICAIDEDAAKDRAVRFALVAEPAIEGNGGDAATFKVACEMRDFGVSRETCLEILSEHYNPRCEPPWEEHELERISKNAYTYAKDRPGNEAPEARIAEATLLFGPPTPRSDVRDGKDGNPEPASAFRVFGDIGHVYVPLEWVIENWIPAGPFSATLFTGEGGTGKSMLSIAMGLSIAAGQPWEGMKTVKTPVVYVSCEDSDEEIDRRVYRHRHYPGREHLMTFDRDFRVMSRVGMNNLIYMSRDGIPTKGPFYDELDKHLGALPRMPRVLILDTLVDMFGGNENSRSDANYFVKTVIGGLCRRHLCTPILLAHPPKSAGATFSGSTAWNNSVRNRIFLKHQNPDSKTRYRILSNEKANHTPDGNELLLKFDRGIYTAVSKIEMEGLGQTAVIGAIQTAQDNGVPLSMSPNSNHYWGKVRMLDSDGQPIAKEVLKVVIDDLISRKVINNISGKSKGNGLHVA